MTAPFAEHLKTLPDLPVIRADIGDLATLGRVCFDAIAKAGNGTPVAYRFGDAPCRIERGDDGGLRVRVLDQNRARHLLSIVAGWEATGKRGQPKDARVPMDAAKQVLATPDPPLPVLARVAAHPYMAQDGSVIAEPGFRDGVYLADRLPGVEVPDAPSVPQVAAARDLILEDLLGDFPFAGDGERAHAVALLVLPFVRDLIDGPTPLHAIDAPTPGTGKTLLVDAVVLPPTGRSAKVMTASANEEEMRKRLTARLTSAPSHLLLDNLTHRVEGASLSALLTTDDTWTDRVLGLSRDIDLPVRCALIATGNNLQASDELARRMIRCRLDAGVDRPQERGDWRHPNLLAWVRNQRAEIVAAVLTLARAWHLARRPYNGPTLGRYEQWAHVVGGILEVAEIDGFLANQHDFYERADRQSTLWREFVEAWWERHGREPDEVRVLFEVADGLLDLGTPGDPDKRRAKLGYLLRARRDRVVGRLRVEQATMSGGHRRWTLREVTP